MTPEFRSHFYFFVIELVVVALLSQPARHDYTVLRATIAQNGA
jgi:hypothetical protein